ncbi:MAG: hypothetical protein EON90_06325, partial [Brevundimonas sp.]
MAEKMTKTSKTAVPTIRRRALLTSAAALAVMTATPALAQTLHLPEGSTHQGNLKLDGEYRLVIDISRLDPLTANVNLGAMNGNPALLENGVITSSYDPDHLWLRADRTQTQNIFFSRVNGAHQVAHAGAFQFNSVVYQASGNDTVLTLQNKGLDPENPGHVFKHDPLRLAGDGTIVLDFVMQADQDAPFPDRAIVVESQEPSQDGDGLLDVVVKGRVDGNAGTITNGQPDPDVGLIDARAANSIRFAAGSVTTAGNNNLVLGGEATVIVDAEATLILKSDADGSHPGRIVRTSGTVVNAGLIDATSNGDSPQTPTLQGDRGVGVYMEGANLQNTVDPSSTFIGKILGGKHAVVVASGDNTISNVSEITSVNGAAILTQSGSTLFRNGIYTFANGTTRAGVVRGGGVNGAKVAYEDAGDSQDVIVNSGTITGDVLLGAGSDTFLYTGATNGVTGRIDGGGGETDAYGVSVSTDGSVTFANDLNDDTATSVIEGFEMHGLELVGPNRSVIVEAAGGIPLTDGVKILGSGAVTNRATIKDDDGIGIAFEHVASLPETGIDFVNEADIDARFGIVAIARLTRVLNRGDVTAYGPAFFYAPQGPVTSTLDFRNEGSLISTSARGETPGAVVFSLRGTDPDQLLADVRNAGVIKNAYSSPDPTEYTSGDGIYLNNYGLGYFNFLNAGTVEVTGDGSVAVVTNGGGNRLANTSIIQAEGRGGGAVLLGVVSPTGRSEDFTNTAQGIVRSNQGGFTIAQRRSFAFGVGSTAINGGTVNVENAGLIEATGPNSIAVAAVGTGSAGANTFNLANSGTIRGGADTVLAAGQEVSDGHLDLGSVLGDEGEQRVVAGGIQTYRTTDFIQNASTGRVIGNVSLHWGDDRFENFGVLEGSIDLGDENDTYVFGAGSTLTGKASGGLGEDLILVDMNGGADRTIDAVQFGGFERIERLAGTAGDGKLYLRGKFDVEEIKLSDLTVYVAEGDTVETTTEFNNAFYGSNVAEGIVNAGTINGGVTLQGGDDRIENTGYIGGLDVTSPYWFPFVTTGSGNDVVVNSGIIQAAGLYLDEGDDVLTNTGTVKAITDLGRGDDELVNGMTGSLQDVRLGDGKDTFQNIGTVSQSVSLDDGDDLFSNSASGVVQGGVSGGKGNDQVINAGKILGNLDLGEGDDRYEAVEGGTVQGSIVGGLGNDTFVFRLGGQTGSIPGGFDGFESFAAYGPGTLQLALDRAYNTLEILEGANLELTNAANYTVDLIKGDDSAQSVSIDAGFSGSVKLFGGDDTLELSLSGLLAGDLDGGEGDDLLKLNLTGASSINGLFGFENVAVTGSSPLTLTGTLDAASGITFDGGANEFIIAENAVFNGKADGGEGQDKLRIATGGTASRTIVTGQITSFEDVFA